MSKCKCEKKACSFKVSETETAKNVLVIECKHCGKGVVSWNFSSLEHQK